MTYVAIGYVALKCAQISSAIPHWSSSIISICQSPEEYFRIDNWKTSHALILFKFPFFPLFFASPPFFKKNLNPLVSLPDYKMQIKVKNKKALKCAKLSCYKQGLLSSCTRNHRQQPRTSAALLVSSPRLQPQKKQQQYESFQITFTSIYYIKRERRR